MNNLEVLLEEVSVIDPIMREDNGNVNQWFAVENQHGVIAYFAHEQDALRFRLSYINAILNPVT